jgi:hypothetical protein
MLLVMLLAVLAARAAWSVGAGCWWLWSVTLRRFAVELGWATAETAPAVDRLWLMRTVTAFAHRQRA